MQFTRFVLAVSLLAPCAVGGGLDKSKVAADAAWVMHVDFEALSRSSLLSALHESGQFVENEFDLDHVKDAFGLEPFADLASITMYASGPNPDGIATVVCGSDKLTSVWTVLASRVPPTRVGGADVIQIGSDGKGRFATLLPASDAAARTAVVATSMGALQRALAVLTKDAPSLALPAPSSSSSARIKAVPTSGSMIFAASAIPANTAGTQVFLDRALNLLMQFANVDGHNSRIFASLVRGLEFELCESHGEFSVRLAVDGEDGEAADQLEQILRAPMNMLRAATKVTEAARRLSSLLEALRIESPAARLSVGYRCDAARFVRDVLFVEKGSAASAGR